MASKKAGSSRESKLSLNRSPVWEKATKDQRRDIETISKEYMDFISRAKTERLVTEVLVEYLEKEGFKPVDKMKGWKAGDRGYLINRGKNIVAFILGKDDLTRGANLVSSHSDSPRLDLKQNPLYEDNDSKISLLKTHYYGGIKKYQWVNIPLALHGKVILADGKEVEIHIGESEDDPVFTIPDLLPHLYRKKQGDRKLPEGIKGEELNVIFASQPYDDHKAKKRVKLWVLDYLNKEYGMVEEDFVSAEIEIVPAGRAREVGLDRSMIGGYGQDDRICAFTSIRALTGIKTPKRTSIALIVDKEEIGSDGPTSIKSMFLEDFYSRIMSLKYPDHSERMLRSALSNTKAISSDVNGAVNPIFKEVHELQNAAKLGFGICITKFTGSGGKFSSNDASAEFMGLIRKTFNGSGVPWQTGELGKVDEGGGGTIAKFLAEHNMDVVDAGPALISMHSPMEISSKADVWATYRAYISFYEMKI